MQFRLSTSQPVANDVFSPVTIGSEPKTLIQVRPKAGPPSVTGWAISLDGPIDAPAVRVELVECDNAAKVRPLAVEEIGCMDQHAIRSGPLSSLDLDEDGTGTGVDAVEEGEWGECVRILDAQMIQPKGQYSIQFPKTTVNMSAGRVLRLRAKSAQPVQAVASITVDF